MRPTKHNHPLTFYAAKWHTSAVTASNYARRGLDWDASDYEVARWLLKYGRKRSPAQRAVIYAVPGISDQPAPEQAVTTSNRPEIDCHAFGKLMTLCCDLEAGTAKLRQGDIEEALRLQKEVVRFNSIFVKLSAGNRQR